MPQGRGAVEVERRAGAQAAVASEAQVVFAAGAQAGEQAPAEQAGPWVVGAAELALRGRAEQASAELASRGRAEQASAVLQAAQVGLRVAQAGRVAQVELPAALAARRAL